MCVTCAIYLKIGVKSVKKKIMYTNVQQYMFQDVAWFMCDI